MISEEYQDKVNKEAEENDKLQRAGTKVALIRISLKGLNAIKRLYPNEYHNSECAMFKAKLKEDLEINRQIVKESGLGLKDRHALEDLNKPFRY